ncbi:hypothetical protein [Thalassotalea ganghwensis]
MRNLVVYCALVLLLLWAFISSVFVPTSDASLEKLNDNLTSVVSHDAPKDVDIKKLSLLLGVDYEEEALVEEVEVTQALEVLLEVVLIYTSKDQQKVRLSKLVNDKKEEVDMQLGDELYHYRLTEISPSVIVFDDGKDKTTLKVFESIIISVLDSPKEKTE